MTITRRFLCESTNWFEFFLLVLQFWKMLVFVANIDIPGIPTEHRSKWLRNQMLNDTFDLHSNRNNAKCRIQLSFPIIAKRLCAQPTLSRWSERCEIFARRLNTPVNVVVMNFKLWKFNSNEIAIFILFQITRFSRRPLFNNASKHFFFFKLSFASNWICQDVKRSFSLADGR